MTLRNVNGQNIAQKKRAKNTFTPSDTTLGAQNIASKLWPIYRPWRGAITKGWTSKLQKQPAPSAWYGRMYDVAFTDQDTPTPTLQPGELQVAKGDITPNSWTAAIDASAGTLTLTWPTSLADETQLATDVVGVALYNTDTGYLYNQTLGVGTRGTGGSMVLNFPAGTFTAGDVVRVIPFMYGAASTDNAGKSSNSENIAVTVVA